MNLVRVNQKKMFLDENLHELSFACSTSAEISPLLTREHESQSLLPVLLMYWQEMRDLSYFLALADFLADQKKSFYRS